MKEFTLKQGLNAVNLLLVTVFLVLALYSAVGQQIFPYIGQYRINIERYLSEQLESVVGIATLSGDMNILTPSIHMEGITISSLEAPDNPSLSIAAVDAVLDPRASLANFTPVFKSVRLSGVSVRVDSRKQDEQEQPADPIVVQKFVENLLLQRHLELNNVAVEIIHDRAIKHVQLDNLVMTGDGFNRLMSGSLSYGESNKIKAGIRLFSQGSPYDLDEFYARGELDLPQLDVDYWLEELTEISLFESFKASAQMRVEFKNGLLNYAKLNMASPKVSLPEQHTFERVNTEVWLKQNSSNTWTLWLDNTQFALNQKKWKLEELALKLSKTAAGNRWQGYIGDLDIPYGIDLVSQLGFMPESISEIIDKLQPTGRIAQASLVIQQEGDASTFTLAGNLNNVSTLASGGIPSIGNVSGIIAATEAGGRVQFSGPDMRLAFPNLYDQPFEFTQGKGQVDWHIRDHEISVVGNGLDFSMEAASRIQGGFDMVLPHHELLDGAIELNLSLIDADVSVQRQLVPRAVNANLKQWLNQSLVKGTVSEAQFYLYNDLAEQGSQTQLELYLNPKNATLSYLPDWPSVDDISGHIMVVNDHVMGQINSASTLGGQMAGTAISYLDDALWISSKLEGDSDQLLSYFKSTPLSSVTGDVLSQWALIGSHSSNLALHIPMKGEVDVTADVSVAMQYANLKMTDIGLTLNQLNGQLNYTSSKGLTSDGITGSIWNEPLNAKVVSSDAGKQTDIQFSTELNVAGLKHWLELDLLEPLSGSAQTKGHFYIDTRENGFTGLKLQSNLDGVAVDLPKPYALASDETRQLDVSVQITDSQLLKLSYGQQVNLALSLKDGQLEAGQVYLGQTEAYVPAESGIVVQGHVDKLVTSEWLDVWRRIQSQSPSTESGENPIRSIQISTDSFIHEDFTFDFVKANILNLDPIWQIDVDAPIAKGRIELAADAPPKLDLEYIHWPMLTANEDAEDSSANDDPLYDVVPSSFPQFSMDVEEIFIGPTNYGRWKFDTEPFENGFRVNNIDGEIKKLAVKGQVEWQKNTQQKIKEYTALDLKLSSSDVGGIQKAWRVKPTIESEAAKADVQFNWLGSPANFQMANFNGSFNLNMKDGRFIEAGDAGALGAFGILNFGAIGRRLRLDFTDIYESGVHFDSVKGKGVIKNGVLNVVDTFNVDGPAAKFAMSGQVNMLTKELDQELSVTFPISSTLPFVAILAGFAPPVAASLFVGERLVGDEIEKYTSATYELTGSWEEPQLKLKKRFDNDIEGKKDKSFWHRMKDIFGLDSD